MPHNISLGDREEYYWFNREDHFESQLEGLDLEQMVWRIRYYRIKKRINCRQMGERIGMNNPRSYARTYENFSHPSGNLDMMKKICEVLEVDKSLVFDDYLNFIDGNYQEKLREIRENLGKTRTDMDKLLNQCRGLYGKWERGGAKPYRKSVEKLLGFLNDNN